MESSVAMNIAIYVYDEAEVLDFSGPFEVFSTANRLAESADLFHVWLIAEKRQVVKARGDYRVLPHYDFANHPDIDVLLIAGGDHRNEISKTAVLEWIQKQAAQARLVASVCTGVFLLAEAGVLKTQSVTTHWEDIPDLRRLYPELQVCENRRWVDEGRFVTSAGISAGIDMSLHLVSRLHSLSLAEKTARQMEFDWTKD